MENEVLRQSADEASVVVALAGVAALELRVVVGHGIVHVSLGNLPHVVDDQVDQEEERLHVPALGVDPDDVARWSMLSTPP